MWPKSWIQGRADVLLALERWRGATAQAWAYSVSHSQFLVRLYREEQTKSDLRQPSLFLYLKGCDCVSFLGIWKDARVHIEEKKGQFGARFVVSDGERFCVDCIAVFAAESVEYLSLEEAGR
jgi:hypothetical protein